MEEKMEEKKLLNGEEAALTKKPYSKPTLSKVQLVAAETVLALCKWGIGQPGRVSCAPDITCVNTWRS
jgi:hypothetical protein